MMNRKSLKAIKAESFVDKYTVKHGFPPTYSEVKKFMGFGSSCQSYGICKKFRHKMVSHKRNIKWEMELYNILHRVRMMPSNKSMEVFDKLITQKMHDAFESGDVNCTEDWNKFIKDYKSK